MKKLFKTVAVVILSPLIFFGLIELALALFGFGEKPRFWIESVTPSGEAQWTANIESPWGGLPFEPGSMPLAKPEGTVRVFCLGGSTTNGFPFARHSSFAKWLKVRLEHLQPGFQFEVIKMGYDAKPAQGVADLFREIVDYEPDLVAIYTGHNQFLAQNLEEVRRPTKTRVFQVVQKTHLGRVLTSLLIKAKESQGLSPAKNPPREIATECFLSADELDVGYALYDDAIAEMQEIAIDRGVPLLFCVPSSNLRFEPRRSFTRSDLSDAERSTLLANVQEGEDLIAKKDWSGAREAFERARRIDKTPALIDFRLGECEYALGGLEIAKELWNQARDNDNHPCRATTRNISILSTRIKGKTMLSDCRPYFDEAAIDGIPGDDLFVDNCHPTLDAQRLISEAILRTLAGSEFLNSAWDFESEPSTEEYRRRMGLDFEVVATDLAYTAIVNMLRLWGRKDSVDPLVPAESTLHFALQHDGNNATAHLGMAMSAILGEDSKRAVNHLQKSLASDPSIWSTFRTVALGMPHGQDLIDRLTPLVEDL